MIFAENLCKCFDDFLAVDGISLNVQPGQVLVLLGPNGAGKTTTVRMLSSVLRPSGGTARVAGYDVVTQADQVRARVGVLTEAHGLYGRMNAVEYLEFFGRLYNLDHKVVRQRSDALLETFGLSSVRRKRLGEYSKGMRQKLALSRALLHDPPVLLLDEPTSAMDPESARLVRDSIHGQRSAERTIILCTHNLYEAEELADQVAIIRHGRIIYNGPKKEFVGELLGPVQFEACFSGDLPEEWKPELPEGIVLTGRGPGWLRFQVDDPQRRNPLLMQYLFGQGIQVYSFQEMAQNMEQAYLEVVNRDVQNESANA